ncbi:hypothetical protein [Phycicoccus sp. Soil748]|uniref:hypothetical protein n=1 Tax=Phycicoccus sp. Soil748 TaxID=1736397 RepID=UPI0007033E1A|nr:hypothetical protein [Phycicoccus sp. Soil748]KRE52626.1 hypothetical protein ASG70_14710 [Phycicoccus sp. Soil748]
MADPAATALLAAATLHLGFQLTVTVLVYPALSRVPADAWSPAHDAHSRAIVPLVVATYGALLATGTWALLTTPMTPGLLLALLGTTVTFATTAFVAAPTHAHLGRDGKTPQAIHRLLLADKVRAAGALVATAGALLNWAQQH